ncbi:hypothetical protein SKAU_G00418400 [Synaphobranchus kaupii]|uniref:Uncharacterized protein n=1 Tax=Synaphobranchus kaupii TaxID=118154 RepID=A0A9Q1E670_SYNKA|nr:hypothetical protein SKAU_G00418400 [Synaphobranchus kaupii]
MSAVMLCVVFRKKRDSHYSESRMKDTEGLILTDGTAAQDEGSIYANKTMLAGTGARGNGLEAALHYATVDFSKLRGRGGEHGTGVIRGASKRTSDYAVIRHKSREEGGGGEEGGEEAKGEAEDKEGPEPSTGPAERETAEARAGEEGEEAEGESRPNTGPQESMEEVTYGNICRSRPALRAQKRQKEPRENPAGEEGEEKEEQREEENSAGGQDDMYVDLISPLTEGNGKETEGSEYAEVRKLQ